MELCKHGKKKVECIECLEERNTVFIERITRDRGTVGQYQKKKAEKVKFKPEKPSFFNAKEYNKKYYQDHKEACRNYAKEYRRKNLERIKQIEREYSRKRRLEHGDEYRSYQREWYKRKRQKLEG
jgi:hypothetical protein